ncbi:Keratin-associated protein 13-3 [Cricetulus griseus]|uniref:Keratin-associated protein n=1 Tax=Cricetulus griseus TaxID=10029 RepID=G3GT18_CRIGR|nr:Keratin-associated protein 13-3 [Cricetulus griseus]
MAYSCCSGNFSSRSLRRCLPSSGSSCDSPYPSNLVYTTTSCSPSTCQLGSSLSSGWQGTCPAARGPVWCPAPARQPATTPGASHLAVPARGHMLGVWALDPAAAVPWAMDLEAATQGAMGPVATDF